MRNLNLWLARKFLISRKKVGFVSWSGIVSVIGVATGCSALLLSIAVLNGFEKEIRDKIVGFETDIRITGPNLDAEKRKQIKNALGRTDGVVKYSFFLERKGVAMHGTYRSLVMVKAVQDSAVGKVYRFDNVELYRGASALPKAHLGRGLANYLGVQVGDSLRLMSPLDSQVYVGFPSTVKVLVNTIFQTNVLDFDEQYCFVPLEVGQSLFRKRATVHGVDVRLGRQVSAASTVRSLQSKLSSDVSVSTWQDLHRTLFSAMRMEKLGSIVVLSLIIVVASFNITSTLVMLVLEKVREIGILRTVGATKERIGWVFALQGVMIGGLGLALGLLLAMSLIFAQHRWGIVTLPEDIYYVRLLPLLSSWDVIVVLLVGSVLIGLSVVYPARAASRLVPREAIHFEK